MPNLSINEASLVLNRLNVSGPLDLFYQLNECYGCPLDQLQPIEQPAGQQELYVLPTKYSLRLELRARAHPNPTWAACRFERLELNSQARYRLDLSGGGGGWGANSGPSVPLECTLKTLHYGECLLCPFAILVCLLFAVVALEQVYSKFLVKKLARRAPSSASGAQHADEVASQSKTDDAGALASIAQVADDAQVAVPAELDLDATPTAATTTPTPEQVQRPEVAPRTAALASRQRVECLDIFRGLTLAAMIFVNYGGAGYAQWEHAPWDGLTLADLVFPFFIFSMGASIAISTRAQVKRHHQTFSSMAAHIFRRSLLLALLGICLNSKSVDYSRADGFARLRLTGVLQRFAASYLVVAFMYTIELTLTKWTRAQSLSNVPFVSELIGIIFEILTALNYTAIYVYVTFFLDYDATGVCPIGYVGPGGQTELSRYLGCTGGAAGWLDRVLLGAEHLYEDHELKRIFRTPLSHDPEGILGFTTSIVLTLIGLQCGKILASRRRAPRQTLWALCKWSLVLGLFSAGAVLQVPINKRLWSLSFVLVSGLAAFLLIAALYALVDLYNCRKALVLRLLSSAGKNSIFLYVGHSLVFGLIPWWFPLDSSASHTLLLVRLTWATLVWLLIAHYLGLKKLFLKL